MQALTRFWRSLEMLIGWGTVTAEWKQMTNGEYHIVRRFLRPSEGLATFYPHPDPGIRIYRVVTQGPDDHVGVCDETGERIDLKDEDLVLWELDRPVLGRALAAALGVRYDEEPVERLPTVVRIGYFVPLAGYSFPVYLAIPSSNSDFPRVIGRLVLSQETPMIILATTRRLLTQWEEELFDRRKTCFLSLEESVQVGADGRMVLTPGGRQRIEDFRQAVVPDAEQDGSVSFFPTPADATWRQVRIRLLDGHTASVVVGEVRGVFNYAQMGMANRKNAAPSVQWELLRIFAARGGVLTWQSPQADRKNQKRRELLARALKEFFRIDRDPFATCGDGWQALFQIETDSAGV